MDEPVYEPYEPRVWCTCDENQLTFVQDGRDGISVVSIPLTAVARYFLG